MIMNRCKRFLGLACGLMAMGVAGCDLDVAAPDGLAPDVALSTVDGLEAATMGNYSILIGSGGRNPPRALNYINEFPSDNVALSGTTGDPLYFTYNYAHFASMGYSTDLWRELYRLIYGANQVIEHIDEGGSTEIQHLKGENLFLRALAHFYLVNIFGRPYPQGADNPGVPYISSIAEATEDLPRASVGEVYDAIESDLLEAAGLMTLDVGPNRATREAAYALLSRLYLYKEDNQKAIEYANKALEEGATLAPTETYRQMNTLAPENNPEAIFAIKHTETDDQGWSAIGAMYYRSPGGVGWGEMYASEDYRQLIGQYPDDVRADWIQPDYQRDENGNIVRDEDGEPVISERNGYPRYYVTKFSGELGIVTLHSPLLLRTAELYLNRAEANAKLGNAAAALEDVNLIRRRAGLSGEALYLLGDLKGHDSVLEVVLEERRLELAFEGHRKFDLFRNGLPMVRDYPGTHLNPSNPGVDMSAGTQIIPADHPRVVYFIPENEIELNPSLMQNP